MDVFTLLARLGGIARWTAFWFVINAVCYWWVGAYVTRTKERGRLALRAVSIVHAVIATVELVETFQLRHLLWPPTVYGAVYDTTAVTWFELAAGYYIWDLITAVFFSYGFAFVIHGAVSFPVFLFAAIGPRQFLHGLYGRFFHGVYSVSTPWLHIRELLIAAKKTDSVWKRVSEYLFALTFVSVRIIFGTFISIRFILQMANVLIWSPDVVHSTFVFLVSIASCTLILFLQLYWFVVEIIPAIRAVLF
jgi:hypothetical protein